MFNFCLCFLCLWLFCKLDQFGFFEVVFNKFYSQTLFISIVSLLRSYLSTSLKSEHVTSTFKYKMLETVLAKPALPWWWVPRLGQSQSWSPLPFYFPWICVTVTVTRSKQHHLVKTMILSPKHPKENENNGGVLLKLIPAICHSCIFGEHWIANRSLAIIVNMW